MNGKIVETLSFHGVTSENKTFHISPPSIQIWVVCSFPLAHGGGGHGEGNKASFFPFEFGLTKSAMQANHSAVLPNLINLYLLQSWLLMNLFPCQESCNKSRVEKIETYTLEWNRFCQQVLLAC